ncbi:auxin-responsive protein SAUR71-like [Oryza brachyantha]|uniref:auxin-responsive protein SAUR71-like n=1 Tax=Oryza brachyantha TaxID=4533 RepID=UPI001AD99FF2|nr:auxin-responsive protein SAUR71-like [Oryza brachyantha]
MKAKRILKRLSRVADDSSLAHAHASAAYQQLRPKAAAAAAPGKVPQGHVPVCVGEEGGPVERFAVRAELLGSPAFAALLRRAAQEYGYGHPGALRIPCPVADFRHLLLSLSSADDHPSSDF